MTTTPRSRRSGGQSQEDRIAERRERLMQAAAVLYGRAGTAGASVTAICAEAGLTPRYFYESFASREALLLAVFSRVCERLAELIEAAVDPADCTGSTLTAFFTQLAEHPQLARVFLVEVDHHDPEMRAVGRAMLERIAGLFAPEAAGHLARMGAMGAIFRIARLWVEGGWADSVADLVTLCRRFVAAAGPAD